MYFFLVFFRIDFFSDVNNVNERMKYFVGDPAGRSIRRRIGFQERKETDADGVVMRSGSRQCIDRINTSVPAVGRSSLHYRGRRPPFIRNTHQPLQRTT